MDFLLEKQEALYELLVISKQKHLWPSSLQSPLIRGGLSVNCFHYLLYVWSFLTAEAS